ncbi:MAG: hypothetical protein ACOYLU_09190, partial [Limisphaerales bacterium]
MKVSKIEAGEFSIGFQSRSFGFFPGLSALSRTGTFRGLAWEIWWKNQPIVENPNKSWRRGGDSNPRYG